MNAVPGETRRVHVLRHAKSSWHDARLDDHERPLAPRGRKATERLAEHLRGLAAPPQLLLCSSAVRAVETLDRVRSGLPDPLEVSIEPDLYGAPAPELLERLRRIPDKTAVVLIIGHNPGLEDLTRGLVADGDPGSLDRLNTKYPTGALATVAFEGAWRAVQWGQARLEAFVTPRELGA